MPSRDQCLPWLHAPYCPRQSLIPQADVVAQSGSYSVCDITHQTPDQKKCFSFRSNV